MNLYNSVQWVLGKILPKSWPWSTGATAKRIVWICHVLIVVGSVGFAFWLVYVLLFDTGAVPAPEGSPGKTQTRTEPPPLPMWVRTLKSLAPLLVPFVSYGIYYYLPEPDEE